MDNKDTLTTEMLDDVIAEKLSDLAHLTPGSEEERRQAEAIAKLFAEKTKSDEVEDEKSYRKHRKVVDWVIGLLKIAVPACVSVGGLILGLNFETDGAYTKQSFREFRQSNRVSFK